MRVIAGEAKGRRLKGPAGEFTRPMTDKVKEALFSTLWSLGVEPDRVLDLYAGTGALGIEALSRGAGWAEFVEQKSAACAVVRDNIAQTRYADVSRVHQLSVASFIGRARPDLEPFDLVIVDPPYADPNIAHTVEEIGRSPLVQSGSVVVVGHWPRLELPERIANLELLRARCHGDSCFSIFEVEGSETA
ncbi:MAG: 16S rRNA (guanine(966)-N(2))-methyltransferase RsmD [Thermomicrobiales bacterium]